MASTKQINGNATNSSGKRKKPRGNKASYLSKWLDKTIHHIEETAPSLETYDSFNSNFNWPVSNGPLATGFDPCRYAYDCTPEPMSLPTLPTYYNPAAVSPFYHPECRYSRDVNKMQVQRPRRRRNDSKPDERHSAPTSTPNNNSNYLEPKNMSDSQDFASLPPNVTSVADTNSNSDVNTNEKDNGSNANTRRYSDPCVRGLPDVARAGNNDLDSESDESSSMSGSQVGSRLLTCLLDQISALKLTNERLNKELMNTKVDLENTRQQNMLLQKGSSSSLGGAGSHMHLNGSGLLNGQYSPGFVTDLVREIRDAARVREEALYSRVRAMVLERTDSGLSSSETKYGENSLEEIKSSLRASEADKRRMMDRIAKLEDELRTLKLNNGSDLNENKLTNIMEEESEAERVRLRKELSDMRKAKQNAEEHTLKLERLVTQLRSKFNGHLNSNSPESLPSDAEHEAIVRARRTSSNSSTTVVFGPVTDL